MTEIVDSFGLYVLTSVSPGASQNSLVTFWNAIGPGGFTMGVQAGAGARGNPALFLPFGAAICKTVSHQPTYTLGLRVSMSCVAGVGGGSSFIQLCNCAQPLCSLKIDSDGSVLVYGNNLLGTVIFTAPAGTFAAATQTYVEITATVTADHLGDMSVTAEAFVNAVSIGSGTTAIGRNISTLKSQTATFNQIFISSGVATNGQAFVSDLYLNNGLGPTNTGRLSLLPPNAIAPYVIVEPIEPNADTSPLNWTPKTPGPHFSQINEIPADGDASYNFAPATPAGTIDNYRWQPIPSFAGTVQSVQLRYQARSTAPGPASYRSTVGPLGTEATGQKASLCSSYNYQGQQTFDLNPATGLPWTQPEFNAKAFGVEVVTLP